MLVTDAPVTVQNRATIDRECGGATVVWITPWGIDGAWAERPATDLCLHAAGGWMAAVGEAGEEPLGPPGPQGRLTAGLFAAMEVVRCLGLPNGDRPRLISVPVVEAVAATGIYDVVAFQYFGRVRERSGERYAPTQPTLMTLPCKDGWVGIHAALHSQWLSLCDVIGHPELKTDPRFVSGVERAAHLAELDGYLLPWLAAKTRFAAYHELQQARIPSSPLPTMTEVLASAQLASRGFWKEMRTPSGRILRVPGAPARIVGTASGGPQPEESHGPWAPGKLRVIDLAMGWAGPMVSEILAFYVADVIKIESHKRFDWWRGSRPPGDDPALALHERSHVFNGVNRGKRGITLDLTLPRGRELALELISRADVVIENFGAGVMEKLRLTYDVLSGRNPRLILLRQPAFGSTGPEAGYVAFGNTMEGMAGLTALLGPENGPPYMMSNAFGDPIGGVNGTIAVLSALEARKRDGLGRSIEAAQIEGFLPMVSAELIEGQVRGTPGRRHGNQRDGSEPGGVFRCAGDDAWVALEVRGDTEWRRLASEIGEAWALAERFETEAARIEWRDALRVAMASWTATRTPAEVVDACVRSGVAAAPVNHEPEMLGDEPLASSGLFSGEDRAVVGYHLYPLLPCLIDGLRATPDRAAPTLGEHNAEVLAAMGLDDADVRLLLEEGVIGEQPALVEETVQTVKTGTG
jgi:crotonobetainyl-CoA:carnitine CoA-transferase CaiB-like acyl-CoA transferase